MLFGFKDNKCKQEVYSKDEVYSKGEIDTKYGTGIEEEKSGYQVIAKGFTEGIAIDESSTVNGTISFIKRNGMVMAHFMIPPTQTANQTIAIFNQDGTSFQIPEKYKVLGSHTKKIIGVNNVLFEGEFTENHSISKGETLVYEGAAVCFSKVINDSTSMAGKFTFIYRETYMAKNP